MTTTSSTADSATNHYPRWHDTVAGAAAGGCARIFTAPFDLLKIRQQLGPLQRKPAATLSRNIFSSFSHIMKNEGGPKSLFRGNLAATYLWVGYAMVQFTLYARTSEFLTSCANNMNTNNVSPAKSFAPSPPFMPSILHKIGSSPVAVSFTSGATAGICATLATYPFDLCRTTFAARGSMVDPDLLGRMKGPSIYDFVKTMYRKNGIRGFYAGSFPAVVQIVPYMGLNFALYDTMMRWSHRQKVSAGMAGVAGFIAGGTSKLLVYPLDTAKKRLQTQVAFSVRRSSYKGLADCLVTITKEEGVPALYRGLLPTMLKSMVGTGLSFGFFTLTKNTLQSIHDNRTR